MECQRSSSSTTRSRYERTFGYSKTRPAVANEMTCCRRLTRFLFSSHARIMRIYRIVVHYPARGGCRTHGHPALGDRAWENCLMRTGPATQQARISSVPPMASMNLASVLTYMSNRVYG